MTGKQKSGITTTILFLAVPLLVGGLVAVGTAVVLVKRRQEFESIWLPHLPAFAETVSGALANAPAVQKKQADDLLEMIRRERDVYVEESKGSADDQSAKTRARVAKRMKTEYGERWTSYEGYIRGKAIVVECDARGTIQILDILTRSLNDDRRATSPNDIGSLIVLMPVQVSDGPVFQSRVGGGNKISVKVEHRDIHVVELKSKEIIASFSVSAPVPDEITMTQAGTRRLDNSTIVQHLNRSLGVKPK